VRNLALRSAESAKNTASLIDESIVRIKNGSDIVTKTDNAFARVTSNAKKIGDLVGEIAAASNEQAQGISQISKAVAEMDKVVQQNAANAEQSASAAEELSAQAMGMKGYVGDMMALVRGDSGVGVSTAKSLTSGAVRRRPLSVRTKASTPKLLAASNKSRKKIVDGGRVVKPSEIIPMDDKDEFKDFR
jgi:methyl-accepting chemotaxis protein